MPSLLATLNTARVTHLDVLVRHTDVVGVGSQILWRGHDGKLYRSFIAESLVCPFPNAANLLDGCDTVVCYEDLSLHRSVSHCASILNEFHLRCFQIAPVLRNTVCIGVLTFVITV